MKRNLSSVGKILYVVNSVCLGVFYVLVARLHSSALDIIATYSRSAFQQSDCSLHCRFKLSTQRGSKPIMSDHRHKWTQREGASEGGSKRGREGEGIYRREKSMLEVHFIRANG